MNTTNRIVLVIAALLIDWVIFFVPCIAIFAGYIILVRPPWFKVWIEQLYT